MKTDIDKLKCKLAERETSIQQVSKALGIDKSTFYRKVNSKGLNFTIGEVHKIVETIPLTTNEAVDIFLSH